MKTIQIKLYPYEELSDKAKDRALKDWNETNDDPFMQSHMINLLKEKLDERKIKYDADSIDVRYSLSHSQGDGFMFIGTLEDELGNPIKITHDGRYYHKYMREIDYHVGSEAKWAAFEKIYNAICDEMERAGYDHIEYQTSAELFGQECESNGWLFEEDGAMRND